MAAKRRSTAALRRGTYNPKVAQAARTRKRVEGPKQKAKRERAAAAKGRLPKPGTQAANRTASRYLPDTDEIRFLKRAARSERIDLLRRGDDGEGEYDRELRELASKHYRTAYNANQEARKAAAPPSPWIHVKAHKRKRPTRRK